MIDTNRCKSDGVISLMCTEKKVDENIEVLRGIIRAVIPAKGSIVMMK